MRHLLGAIHWASGNAQDIRQGKWNSYLKATDLKIIDSRQIGLEAPKPFYGKKEEILKDRH